MPELPEVETVCRGLVAHIVPARVLEVIVRRRNLRAPLPDNLEASLAGRELQRITRRAKYILMHFDDGQVLIAHLGMSGRMLLHKENPPEAQKHDHVIIQWDNGYTLIFNDARRFGLMSLTHVNALTHHILLRGLGPEPLNDGWGTASLREILKASRAPVKSVIMDQRKLVGVGNIYACEALFRAGIRPTRPSYKVSGRETEKLAVAIREVLEEAIVSGGSTLRDYVRSSGDSGYFQHRFAVYGRDTLPCNACKKPIKIIRQSGRSSFFCTECQH